MSTAPTIIDFISTRNAHNSNAAGLNYAISDIAALPAAFTSAFDSISLTTAAAQYGTQKEVAGMSILGIQIIVDTKGAGFSGTSVQLQVSNVGGTEDKVWVNLGSPVAVTDVGSGLVPVPTHIFKMYKFYRLQFTTSGGVCTAYAIGYANVVA